MHVLASNYHWTEDVILSMPLVRLRRYLGELAADQGAPAEPEWTGPSEELERVRMIMMRRLHG